MLDRADWPDRHFVPCTYMEVWHVAQTNVFGRRCMMHLLLCTYIPANVTCFSFAHHGMWYSTIFDHAYCWFTTPSIPAVTHRVCTRYYCWSKHRCFLKPYPNLPRSLTNIYLWVRKKELWYTVRLKSRRLPSRWWVSHLYILWSGYCSSYLQQEDTRIICDLITACEVWNEFPCHEPNCSFVHRCIGTSQVAKFMFISTIRSSYSRCP